MCLPGKKSQGEGLGKLGFCLPDAGFIGGGARLGGLKVLACAAASGRESIIGFVGGPRIGLNKKRPHRCIRNTHTHTRTNTYSLRRRPPALAQLFGLPRLLRAEKGGMGGGTANWARHEGGKGHRCCLSGRLLARSVARTALVRDPVSSSLLGCRRRRRRRHRSFFTTGNWADLWPSQPLQSPWPAA